MSVPESSNDAVYGWVEGKWKSGARGRRCRRRADCVKVKMQRPEAEIMYVRRANKRGDARNPAQALKKMR